jgi:hypothetical protein
VWFVVGVTAFLGFWGVYCCLFYQFWTHVDTRGFQALEEFRSPAVTGHRGRQILVHRDFVPLMKTLESLALERGVTLLVTGSYRRPDARLTDTVVTPASRSNHLAGHAVDLNVRLRGRLHESADLTLSAWDRLAPEVRSFLEAVRGEEALRWGGDFFREDPVHVDSNLNQADPGRWERCAAACLEDISSAPPRWRSRLPWSPGVKP